MLKQIDRMLIVAFIPPFIVTFLIAMFVLLMQVLWLYIDDLAGKGLGFFWVMELLGYRSMALVPMALPLAMLISSVMVLGGMAEKYELSSFKSAGVSLLRVMRPILVFGLLMMVFSYVCSNWLIPVANLKFGSRMYDIQRQKPSLRLDEGVFNSDFEGYTIHIGDKKPDGRNFENVIIYNHSDFGRQDYNQVIAKTGEMYTSENGRYFIMKMLDGKQYSEVRQRTYSGSENYPFVRVAFSEWTKVFDMSQFEIASTDPELFRHNKGMMTIGQLNDAIDTIDVEIKDRLNTLNTNIMQFFSTLAEDTAQYIEAKVEQPTYTGKLQRIGIKIDTSTSLDSAALASKDTAEVADSGISIPWYSPSLVQVSQFDSLPTSFVQTLKPDEKRTQLSRALTTVRTMQGQADSAVRTLEYQRENRVKYVYELYTKYSMAVVCFIFLFIGAPMGAIIRKGGFGYPILVSIVFFMVFVILTILCRKIAETSVLPPILAAWIPCLILFPVGLGLTYRAMNDSKKVLDFDPRSWIRWFRQLKKSRV